MKARQSYGTLILPQPPPARVNMRASMFWQLLGIAFGLGFCAAIGAVLWIQSQH